VVHTEDGLKHNRSTDSGVRTCPVHKENVVSWNSLSRIVTLKFVQRKYTLNTHPATRDNGIRSTESRTSKITHSTHTTPQHTSLTHLNTRPHQPQDKMTVVTRSRACTPLSPIKWHYTGAARLSQIHPNRRCAVRRATSKTPCPKSPNRRKKSREERQRRDAKAPSPSFSLISSLSGNDESLETERELTSSRKPGPVRFRLRFDPMAHVTPKKTLFKEEFGGKKKPVKITLRVNRSPRLVITMEDRVPVGCKVIQ
jgi:hypothetical protein